MLRNGISKWLPVISGVPQGSILGPILFLLYINDLPNEITSLLKMFTDDTKLYRTVTVEQDCENLQRDLNRLAAWSKTWLLKFNKDKCVVLKFRDCIKFSYSLNGVDLQEVDSQRDLGILINNKLTPVNHIESITKKANAKITSGARFSKNYS